TQQRRGGVSLDRLLRARQLRRYGCEIASAATTLRGSDDQGCTRGLARHPARTDDAGGIAPGAVHALRGPATGCAAARDYGRDEGEAAGLSETQAVLRGS